jgi:hypothetical protein
MSKSTALRALPAFLVLFAAVVLLAQMAADRADGATAAKFTTAAKSTAKVKVAVKTKSQRQLLNRGKLQVALKAKGSKKQKRRIVKLKVTARGQGKGKLFKTKKLKKLPKKAVKLPLTARGKKRLGGCGDQLVKVKVTYKTKGKKGKRKAKAKRKLKADPSLCGQPYRPVPTENADRCDFLDPAVCLQPFPNDYFATNASSTPTGKRLNLNRESMPANTSGVHIDPTDMNRADGFSPGNKIIVKIPEVETPAAFENSGMVPVDDLQAYEDPNQAVIVINAETGERHPIWAELDANPTTVDPGPGGPGGINANPSNTGDVNLIIRPARNFDFGERYIVALRNLRNASNQPVEAPIGFRVYRDNDITDQPEVESRRGHMNSVINTLVNDAGVNRNSLYMAWDFTVASQESVTGRATTIRDDAFERLGDTDLADRKIDGDSPDWTITNVQDGVNASTVRRVQGTIDVPCYLDEDGCETGAKFAHAANGDITWNEGFRRDVPFQCDIPASVVAGDTLHPTAVGIYGHGLLGSRSQVSGQATLANNANTVWCAVDWEGFATQDLPTVIPTLSDMSGFKKLADRMQQGFVNFLYLGRALVHPDGLATDEAFEIDPDGPDPEDPGSVIDTSAGEDTRLQIMGISQGGIMGGALTALAPDADYGVLGVPGMNYSTLLRRSVDSDAYFKLPGAGLYANYPDELERPLLLSLAQLLWDRGEANGYAHNMTDDPLPNTNPHEVLLRVALGDHQVANVTAEVEARTAGIAVYSPALEPGRHWEDNPFMGLQQVDAFPYTDGSMLVYYDGGPVGFAGTHGGGSATPPNENVPPRPEWGFGADPHSYPRRSADGLAHAESFLAGNGVPACADSEGYCFANGWTGAP